MRYLFLAAALGLLLLCGLGARPAAAADAGLKITVTNGGKDVGGDLGGFNIRPNGQHDADVIVSGRSGDTVSVAAGTYSVDVRFSDGAANKTIWLDNLALTGNVTRNVEMALSVASLKLVVTNGGKDAGGQGGFNIRPNGQHNADVIINGGSGDTVRLAAGTYSIDVHFDDGAAGKIVWLDNVALSGAVSKSVEAGVAVASLKVVVTNGGKDVGALGGFEVRPNGQHNADVIASGGSGDTVRLAAGTYSIDARLRDGTVDKFAWLDNVALNGAVAKTMEIGAKLATVKWHILDHGKDLGADAVYELRSDGNHGGDVIANAASGQPVRIEAGTYDVDFRYVKGLVNKIVWLDHQVLTADGDHTTDLMLNLANLALAATLNGADVGNKARIGIMLAGQPDEIGEAQSGDTVLVEGGRYDVSATLPGAEGTLHNVAVAGPGTAKAIVPMKPLVTAELKVGGPPPKACTIEVYGVNFDFDKSDLRPDSEPVLQSVLQLFTATPAFSAEVGGHTDNIGKPDYNMKLSEARADAVKTWLIAHKVAATRVTAHGYGDTHPLVPNDNDADRFKNRRVELRRMNCQ